MAARIAFLRRALDLLCADASDLDSAPVRLNLQHRQAEHNSVVPVDVLLRLVGARAVLRILGSGIGAWAASR